MEFDADDFPDGFRGESLWGKVTAVLQHRGKKSVNKYSGLTGSMASDGRTRYKRFYDNHKTNAVWMAKRRAYYRAWRASRKTARRLRASSDAPLQTPGS